LIEKEATRKRRSHVKPRICNPVVRDTQRVRLEEDGTTASCRNARIHTLTKGIQTARRR
jgi:hypothetical protein